MKFVPSYSLADEPGLPYIVNLTTLACNLIYNMIAFAIEVTEKCSGVMKQAGLMSTVVVLLHTTQTTLTILCYCY